MAGLQAYAEQGDDLVGVIPLPNGGELVVSGLSLADISRLIRARTADMEVFFNKFMAEKKASADPKFADAAATEFGRELLTAAPDIAADIIALASGEPTLTHVARKLPFPIQLEALEQIANLTFVGEDGLKKAIEIVIRMVAGATGTFSDLNVSRIGSLVSVGK